MGCCRGCCMLMGREFCETDFLGRRVGDSGTPERKISFFPIYTIYQSRTVGKKLFWGRAELGAPGAPPVSERGEKE